MSTPTNPSGTTRRVGLLEVEGLLRDLGLRVESASGRGLDNTEVCLHLPNGETLFVGAEVFGEDGFSPDGSPRLYFEIPADSRSGLACIQRTGHGFTEAITVEDFVNLVVQDEEAGLDLLDEMSALRPGEELVSNTDTEFRETAYVIDRYEFDRQLADFRHDYERGPE